MKNSLSSQYKAWFGETLKPHGFLLYKKTFYRVINYVIQTLMLRTISTHFTIDFSILPLSLPITDLYAEGYDISVLGGKGWWECWEGVDGNTFTEALSLFRRYVIPIFERGVDSKTAYDELVNYEKMVFTGIPGGIIMNNYCFVLMCTKINDYAKAYQHMAAIIKQNLGIADRDLYDKTLQLIIDLQEKKREMEAYSLFIEQFNPAIQDRMETLRKISVPDVEYFQNLIAQNEAISLEYLKHPSKRQ